MYVNKIKSIRKRDMTEYLINLEYGLNSGSCGGCTGLGGSSALTSGCSAGTAVGSGSGSSFIGSTISTGRCTLEVSRYIRLLLKMFNNFREMSLYSLLS